MSLPPQEKKDSYSYDEVQHIVAREWARNEIVTLRNGQLDLQKQMVDITGNLASELKSMRELFATFPDMVSRQISACRTDIKREIENEFPTRIESLKMEQRIEEKVADTDSKLGAQISQLDRKVDGLENKIDKQWLKISVAVGTLGALGAFVSWAISTSKAIL